MSWFSKIASVGTLVLYHATLAGSKILNGGFKTRDELAGQSGLGGGPSDSISFTTDWATAKGIFDALLFFWKLANSPNPIQAMNQHFSSLPQDKQQKLVAMHKGGSGRDLLIDLSGHKRGGVFSWEPSSKSPLSAEEIKVRGFSLDPNNQSETEDGRYYNWLEPMDGKDIQELLYSYVKSYFASDEDIYNPLFFGASPQYFVGIPRGDIGILTVEAEIDPSTSGDFRRKDRRVTYGPVGSMAEIRVFDTSIIKRILNYDTNPSDTPPASSLSQFRSESGMLEQAGNIIIKVVKKHYAYLQKFLKGKIALDGLISAVQTADDPYKMYQIVSYILKESDLSFYLDEFKKIQKCRKEMKIPPEIEQPIAALPEKYKQMLFSGEKIEDIVDQWYDQDRNAYSDWTTGFGEYDIERPIRDWQYEYNYFKKQYDSILADLQRTILANEDIVALSEFATALDAVRNIPRDQ